MSRMSPTEMALLADSAHKLAEGIAPYGATMDEEERFDPAVLELLRSRGAWEMVLPGSDAVPSMTAQSIVIEAVATVCTSTAVLLQSQATTVHTMHLAGGDEADRVADMIAGGHGLCGWAVTEPDAGSDILAMRTIAEPDGTGYRLTGEKRFITNVGLVDEYIVFARTSDERSSTSLTAFLVPADAPGLEVSRTERKMGLRASPTGDLMLDGVAVPSSAVLGAVGAGMQLALGTLQWSRPLVGAVGLGVGRGAFEDAFAYAQQRQQFGRPIIEFQAIGHMLADMLSKVLSARHLLYGLSGTIDETGRQPTGWEGAVIKAACSDMAMSVTTDAVQVLGGYGYIRDYPVERKMRDAKILQIFEGTNQIQRNQIIRDIRGQDPRALWALG